VEFDPPFLLLRILTLAFAIPHFLCNKHKVRMRIRPFESLDRADERDRIVSVEHRR